MLEELNQLIHARKGHFLLESGHHGDLWLDLELLCLHPDKIEPLARELAKRLSPYRIDAVCGPLVEGAFVGLMVAKELNVDLLYSAQRPNGDNSKLYPMAYELPVALRQRAAGKRVAIVNDVINAGSAVTGTHRDLAGCGADVVAWATLLTLGTTPQSLAKEWSVDLITLAARANAIWKPEECLLCANGAPLTMGRHFLR